jgi:hypothetical protein
VCSSSSGDHFNELIVVSNHLASAIFCIFTRPLRVDYGPKANVLITTPPSGSAGLTEMLMHIVGIDSPILVRRCGPRVRGTSPALC